MASSMTIQEYAWQKELTIIQDCVSRVQMEKLIGNFKSGYSCQEISKLIMAWDLIAILVFCFLFSGQGRSRHNNKPQ